MCYTFIHTFLLVFVTQMTVMSMVYYNNNNNPNFLGGNKIKALTDGLDYSQRIFLVVNLTGVPPCQNCLKYTPNYNVVVIKYHILIPRNAIFCDNNKFNIINPISNNTTSCDGFC